MADFRTHVTVSGVLGAGYALLATSSGHTGVQAVLAGLLTGCAGMLPDLDSDTGKPLREVFGLTAALAPILMRERLLRFGGNAESALLLGILVYVTIRYGASTILGLLTVHRGMFHSLPAAAIAGELTFLGYESPVIGVRLLMSGGVILGFLSHLILDEVYSVQWNGLKVRLKSSAGSAMKFFGSEFIPNVVCWGMLGALSWISLQQSQLIERGDDSVPNFAQPDRGYRPRNAVSPSRERF